MITVDREVISGKSSSFQDQADTLRSLYITFIAEAKESMRQTLQQALASWVADDEVLSYYPFFSDKMHLVYSYMDAINLVVDGDVITLTIDQAQLKSSGLPTNLHKLLEYGNPVVPPFPHIRPVLQQLRTRVSQGLKAAVK